MTVPDDISSYDPDGDFDARFTLATGRRLVGWLGPQDRVLELGCATGLMTSMLVGDARDVVAVDRSVPYLERARARNLTGVRYITADIEATDDALGTFDHVVLTNVLHHLSDPIAVLASVRAHHLAPGGLVHVTLQNPLSLHRLVAREMQLLDDLTALSERNHHHAVQRIWPAAEVVAMAASAGLEERHREGIFLKPLPNAEMEKLPDAVLDGFEGVVRHFPEHGAMNMFAFGHPR